MPRLSIRSNNNTNMVQCKKHPKHKQSPGVCSLCLGEKLSRVSTSNNVCSSRDGYASRAREYYCSSSSSVSSSEDESSYASSCVSPPSMHGDEGRRRRILSDIDLNLMKYLSKSKSMPLGSKGDVDKKKKVFGGFWSKFLRPRKYNHHNLKNMDIISNNNNNNVNNKVYMSQPLDVASSSSMAVC